MNENTKYILKIKLKGRISYSKTEGIKESDATYTMYINKDTAEWMESPLSKLPKMSNWGSLPKKKRLELHFKNLMEYFEGTSFYYEAL